MAEIAFDGPYDEVHLPNEEWGLDGWTSHNLFKLLITGEETAGLAHLNAEQCSMLAAILLEHVKEVNDASKEGSS